MSKLKTITFTIVTAISFLVILAFPADIHAAANDDFYSATQINDLPFTDSIDTSDATTGPSDPWPCGYYAYNSVWYRFTPNESMAVQIDTNGSSYSTAFAAYTGDYQSGLSEVGCASYGSSLTLTFAAGTTYHIQVVAIGGTPYPGSLQLVFHMSQVVGPVNDNFADALAIASLPFVHTGDNSAATLEYGEPTPSCVGMYDYNRTLWFAYTPEVNQSVTSYVNQWYYFTAVYSGSELSNLVELGCRSWGDRLTISANAGETIYFQIGSRYQGDYGVSTFYLDITPPPTADFNFWPSDPNVYDNITFCDSSYDPGNAGFSDFWWDFGDGATSTENCTNHQYLADGDYTVWHQVQTHDGRTAEVSKGVQVRTHDVAITKFAVPKSANSGQTRSITVSLRNWRYPETVTVELFKSVPGGFEFIGSLRQFVPVRSGNRTTNFSLSYTFTSEDAEIGKVTFKAVAYLIDARESFQADNEAISFPTSVRR